LHIEVGGTYGGSTKALELYLRGADCERFKHSLLLYYPTPRTQPLESLAGTSVLHTGPPNPGLSISRPSLQFLRQHQLLHDCLLLIGAFKHANALSRFMRSQGFDVVHINNTFTYQPASILAATRVGIPVVAHVRNAVRLSLVTKALARRVRCFVAVSETLTQSLSKYPVQHIRDAIETKRCKPEVVAGVRRALGSQRLIVGSVGRLDEQKGYEYLIRAAQVVRKAHPEVLFVVAGDGPQRDELQDLIDSLDLRAHFRLLGFRSDAEVVTSAFDLYVCPSLWEGLPLTVLDAMALEVPVISTAVGGIREAINDGESGWLVEPESAQALARSILYASSISNETRRKLIRAASCAVAPFQDLKGLAREFEAVL
jgi:glycosyltransferase involved in cell wall biosynthesis